MPRTYKPKPKLPAPTLADITHLKCVPSCNLCQSPKRQTLELLLAYRQRRIPLPHDLATGLPGTRERDGSLKINTEWLEKHSAEVTGGWRIWPTSAGHHMKTHCAVGAAAAPQVLGKPTDRGTALAAWAANGGTLEDVPQGQEGDALLRAIVQQGRRLVEADPRAVSIEHSIRAAAELNKRADQDATSRMLMLLAESQAAAMGAVAVVVGDREKPIESTAVEVAELGPEDDE